MESGNTRVRVSLRAGELEIEGSEDFVEKYADAIQTMISRLQSTPMTEPAAPEGPGPKGAESSTGLEFPEALHQFSSKSGTDQILFAGAFARMKRDDGTFSTSDANNLLVEQGIKLANASQSMANNLKAKRVFKSGKNWKISRTGEEYLQSLGAKVPR